MKIVGCLLTAFLTLVVVVGVISVLVVTLGSALVPFLKLAVFLVILGGIMSLFS